MKIDFIVIGASRSGTTWLHDNIIYHPEVYLPKKVNEPTFFTKFYDLGFEYYKNLFDTVKNEKAIGEITPDYLYSVNAAKRIKKHFPNVKLIVILRNPWERLYSMYWMLRGQKLNGFDKISFKESYQNNQEFLEKGKYIKHINELKQNPELLLKNIFKFIGVDDSFQAPFIKTKINSSKFQGINGRSILLLFLWKISQKFKFKKIAFKIENLNSNIQNNISKDDKKQLIEYYKDSNLELQKIITFDISKWNKFDD